MPLAKLNERTTALIAAEEGSSYEADDDNKGAESEVSENSEFTPEQSFLVQSKTAFLAWIEKARIEHTILLLFA